MARSVPEMKPATANDKSDAIWSMVSVVPDDTIKGKLSKAANVCLAIGKSVSFEAMTNFRSDVPWYRRVVAGMNIAGSIFSLANEYAHGPLDENAKRAGYVQLTQENVSSLTTVFRRHTHLFRLTPTSFNWLPSWHASHIFEDRDRGILFVFSHEPGGPESNIPPLTTAYERVKGSVKKLSVDLFWVKGDELDFAYDGDSVVTRPMPAISDYIGEPSPAALAEQLRLREKAGVLIVGPSGEGKTTLARQTCALLGKRRVIRTGGADNLKYSDKIMALIADNKPDAVIVDDMQDVFSKVTYMGDSERSRVLNTLERINASGVLLFGTIMEDNPNRLAAIENRLPGALYYPGLRPGRFDIVITFKHRTQDERFALLRHYANRDISDAALRAVAEQCGGLTGAYLKGLAESLTVNGSNTEEALKSLLCMCPSKTESWNERGNHAS